MCAITCVGNTVYSQTHRLPSPSPSRFNESQFPTARHITPLNDLIKQAWPLLSPAISLFTTESKAVTQPPPRSSLVNPLLGPYRDAVTSPFSNKLSTFPFQSVFTQRYHLPLNIQLTGFGTVTPETQRGL